MANDTEQHSGGAVAENGEVDMKTKLKQVKAYRKKGLVSDKVLLERLSDMSIEDNLSNPAITLSSVEDDSDDIYGAAEPMEQDPVSTRGSLINTPSLDVPIMNLSQEAKRPPPV